MGESRGRTVAVETKSSDGTATATEVPCMIKDGRRREIAPG